MSGSWIRAGRQLARPLKEGELRWNWLCLCRLLPEMLPGFVLLVPYRPQISRQLFPRLESFVDGRLNIPRNFNRGWLRTRRYTYQPVQQLPVLETDWTGRWDVSSRPAGARPFVVELHQRVGWVDDEYSLPSRRPKCSSRGFFVLRRTVFQHTRNKFWIPLLFSCWKIRRVEQKWEWIETE